METIHNLEVLYEDKIFGIIGKMDYRIERHMAPIYTMGTSIPNKKSGIFANVTFNFINVINIPEHSDLILKYNGNQIMKLVDVIFYLDEDTGINSIDIKPGVEIKAYARYMIPIQN